MFFILNCFMNYCKTIQSCPTMIRGHLLPNYKMSEQGYSKVGTSGSGCNS